MSRARNRSRKSIRSASGLESAAKRLRAEVISVDLFDTLVFREVLEPNSVFRLQYLACAGLLDGMEPADWLRCRKKAEEMLAGGSWPAEIQLAAIYDWIASELDLCPDTRQGLMDAELAAEADTVRPYRDLVDVLRRLHAEGCTVAVTTDTYLPATFITGLLDRFIDFEYTLLCSSEIGKTKRSGTAFADLRSVFANRRIVHFGDNPHSDVTMARRSGVKAFQIKWSRQEALEERELGRYARDRHVSTLRTPWDGMTDAIASPVDQIAWRWSFVLADFLSSVREYADLIDATDIWFLSRDSETMFKSLGDVPAFFSGRRCSYVYGSRACVYPVIARSDPDLYEKWRGRPPTEQVQREGDVARQYYRSLICSDTERLLIVDIGWKGRLQILFKRIMPENVDVFGYYFSLEPAAVPAIQTISGTFLDWNPSVFNQAMVEALSGYIEASATSVRVNQGRFEPVFREGPGDRSPVAYCENLRVFLAELLRGDIRSTAVADRQSPKSRKSIVRMMSLFPDRTMVSGFAEWSIGTLIDGSDTLNIANGGRATWWQKLAGRGDGGNVWPSAAIWTLTKNELVGRTLQHVIRTLFAMKYLIEGRSYARSQPGTRQARQ